MQNRSQTSDFGDWQVESLRLTAFLSAPLPAVPETWWSELAGQPPDSQNTRPKEGRWQFDGAVTNPDLSNALLILRGENQRLDWLLQPAPLAEEGRPPDIESAYVGYFPPAMTAFVGLIGSWLATASIEISRLAFGVTLRLPIDSRELGYSVLSELLPFPLDPNSTDFLYRINHPVQSESLGDGTILNRLSTWAVVQIDTLVLSVSGGHAGTERLSKRGQPFYACRLEFDINTAADRPGAIPQDRYGALLSEFVSVPASFLTERGQS